MKRVLGIIGGMGPLATADLFRKIIEHTEALRDQDHIHILIDNDTLIPDRTAAILNGSDAPLEEMSRAAQRLVQAGSEILLIPCNTAHYFYEGLCGRVSVLVLNMLEETAKQLSVMGIRRAGLLATDGTIRSGVYEKYLRKYEIEPVLPSQAAQQQVMHLIYDGIKAGNTSFDTKPFCAVLEELEKQGAEILILGCTELPIAFSQYQLPGRCIDPTTVLAEAAVRAAGYSVKA